MFFKVIFLLKRKELFSIDQAPPVSDYDLIAVGFWFQAGKPDPKAIDYLSKLSSDSNVFLFASHGAAKNSPFLPNSSYYKSRYVHIDIFLPFIE